MRPYRADMVRRYHPFANGEPSSRVHPGPANFGHRATYEISRPAQIQHGGEMGRNHGRKRIAVACSRCRKRKIRCSGDCGDGLGCDACKANNNGPCQFLRVSSTEVTGIFEDYPSMTVEAYPSPGDVGMFGPVMPAGLGTPAYSNNHQMQQFASTPYLNPASAEAHEFSASQADVPLETYRYNANVRGPASPVSNMYQNYPAREEFEQQTYRPGTATAVMLGPDSTIQSSFATMDDLAQNLPSPPTSGRLLPMPRGHPHGGMARPSEAHENVGGTVGGNAELSHPPVLRSQGYDNDQGHSSQHQFDNCHVPVVLRTGTHHASDRADNVDVNRPQRAAHRVLGSQSLPEPQAPTGFPSSCTEGTHTTQANIMK